MSTAAESAAPKMRYRFLGNSGLLVSTLSLGTWMQMDERCSEDKWYELMKFAFEQGVNFFDNAELYIFGKSEEFVGSAIQRGLADGVWTREDLVITTKIFSGAPTAAG